MIDREGTVVRWVFNVLILALPFALAHYAWTHQTVWMWIGIAAVVLWLIDYVIAREDRAKRERES